MSEIFRDPERVGLRMSDPHDPESVRRVMERLGEVRGEFCNTLRSIDARLLAARPSPEGLAQHDLGHIREAEALIRVG